MQKKTQEKIFTSLGQANNFLATIPKSTIHKRKKKHLIKRYFIKMKNFSLKHHIKRQKRLGENIYKSQSS